MEHKKQDRLPSARPSAVVVGPAEVVRGRDADGGDDCLDTAAPLATVLSKADDLPVSPLGVLLVGNDTAGLAVRRAAALEFGGSAVVETALDRTPVRGERRPNVLCGGLPPRAAAAVDAASWAVIAPMAAGDHLFVRSALTAARQSVLLLSDEQLAQPDLADELAVLADLVVLDRSQLFRSTGRSSVTAALRRLSERGIERVAVVSPNRISVHWDGECFEAASPSRDGAEPSPGAALCFAVAIAGLRALGARPAEAVRLAAATTARMGVRPSGTRSRSSTGRARHRPRARGSFHAAAALVGVAVGGLLATAVMLGLPGLGLPGLGLPG
jgi:hypothetical protein